jgi:hypothetical protein
MPDICRRRPRAIEVNTFDQRVSGEHGVGVPWRCHDCRIVTHAHHNVRGGFGEPGANSRKQAALAQL